MANVKCSVIPHKKYSGISYRVKCVAVENERVFGDVFVTHQTQNQPVYSAGFSYPLIGQRKKRNLIYQTIVGPNLMELNRKVPVRRASDLTGSKIHALTKRSKSMGDGAAIFDFNAGPEVTTEVIKKPKTYPAPLPSVAKPEVKLTSLVDQLLLDIYGLPAGDRGRSESDSTASSLRPRPQHEHLQKARLVLKSKSELHVLVITLREHINHTGGLLVRQLRRRDYLIAKRDKQCAIVTAHLQAHSAKRLEDTKMRFSLTPQPGESGFTQWLDAMKMVARLQGGIPPEFRKRLWLTLAERHLEQRGVDWKQAEKVCFNEWSNPDDEELGIQIVKDLHRTGCSLFCGAAGRDNQAVLRRVLLGFARWNKSVGYCQGLNVLAALVLQVMDRAESSAVKVMIYLIEGVLPEGYFADNLRGLSVDMAVFRDLLRARQPKLSKHLEALQSDAKDKATGSSYEPPLTNVFTMQWFLTLFCHCLPQEAVLRVWDLIFLEGDEVLLRTALAIWEGLSDRIMTVTSADEFYSIMGVLTREMLEFTDTNNLIKNIVSMGPLDGVTDLREKHRYNITPWGRKLSDDEDSDTEEDERLAVAAAMFSMAQRLKKERIPATMGALQAMAPGSDRERLALDISTLKQQYARLRERQRQAHIILSAACARQSMVPTPTSQAMNHLLVGKNALVSAKSRPLSLPAAAPSPKSKPASTNSPRSQNRKDRQGVTLHWKDTKRSKQKPGQSSDTPECGTTTLMQSPPETAVSLTSPKRASADSDSDSTSTELCDEPDRLSDVDSEELTSASDCYVMATDDERNPPLDATPTLSGSESGRLPEVCEPDAEGAPKEKPIGANSCQPRVTERSLDEDREEERTNEVSASLSEISIAKITDQIRRLSAEDDNTSISLTPADLPTDKTATAVAAAEMAAEMAADNEKSPNLARDPLREMESKVGSEFIADQASAPSRTAVSFDYLSFSSNALRGESEGSGYAASSMANGTAEDRRSGTAGDEGTEEVAAESFREVFTEFAGDSPAADSQKKIGVANAEDKRSEILRPADYDGLKGIVDAGDGHFEKSLSSDCDRTKGGDAEMRFEKSLSADYGKPTRAAGGKLFDMSLDADLDKSMRAQETKADRFESLVAGYDKPALTSDAEMKRFQTPSAADYDKMRATPDAEVNRVAKSFGTENELTARAQDPEVKRFDASLDTVFDKNVLTLSTDAKRFERSLVTESVPSSRGQETEDKRFDSFLGSDYDKSLRTPDADAKRFEKSIIMEHDKSSRTLDTQDKRFELLLGTNYDKSIRSTDNDAKGYERSLDAEVEKSRRASDMKDNDFESLLAGDYGKAKKTPDTEFKRYEKSFEKPLTIDFDKTTRIPDREDDLFEKLGLSSKTSARRVVDVDEGCFEKFDVSNKTSTRVSSVEEDRFEKLELSGKAAGVKTTAVPVVLDIPSTKTPSGLTAERTFYSKQYVMGHLPISPVNVDQKLNKGTGINYSIGSISSQESSTIPEVTLEKVVFEERQIAAHTRTFSELKSPKTPESSKSFSSGDTMGPDSKPSSLTISPRTPRSESRDFPVDKSVTSSMSSDSKTLILPSLESDPIRGSPRTDSKKASYDKSNPSTPISTDSLKNKSDVSPKLIVSSSSDSCSPSKVKSSERSFSSDLQSPISANSIKYTSNFNKRGQDNVSDSPVDMTSPFYPIAHPNQKTPSPYNANRRRRSGESLETSPEQKSTSSKESAKFLGYQTKLDPSLQIVEAREVDGCSKVSDIYIRPQFTLSKEELTSTKGSRETEPTTYASKDSYRKSRQFVEESSEDLSSEQDVLAQLPQEKLDKHFMNFTYRHKDRRNVERSSSSLERRFTELKSSVSTDEFGTSVAKKRSSDILEDIKHLEAKAFSDGSSDPSMLTKKTSYIWEDLKNLEARRQDTFSDSATTFSKRRLEVPDISVTSANRKSYVVHPKINIDESSDSILKTVACNDNVNNGDSDDGRESKLGVWTKVKPRKRGNNGRRSSDRALKIIQENSAILHKILACQAKKRLPDLEEISKEITISPINEEISKIFSPILEKMGLNEHEINEELARINFKDFDSVTTTSVSEFDAKINDELSKLSLIDDSEQIDHFDVDEIISHEYLDTREALIDRKINEELSKLLANYEEDSPPSVVNVDKGSSSQNVSDIEGLDLTSISTNVFSYKSSNDSIETRSEFGSGQEAGIVQAEKFPAYPEKMLHYTSPKYVQDLSPKSDIDIYRELEKLDKISSGQIFAHTTLEAPQKNLSPIPYTPHTSPYNEVSPVMRYSSKAYDTSPLKTSYNPYRAFDYQPSLSPRKAPTNSYPYDKPSSTLMGASGFEYIEHKTMSNTYDLPMKSPIMSKESLEFRVRYDDESPRQVNRDFLQTNDRPTVHIDKSAPYYSNGSAKPITPNYITTEERCLDSAAASYLQYSAENSDSFRRKYEALSPKEYVDQTRLEYERSMCTLPPLEPNSDIGSYLPTRHKDYSVLSPSRRFGDQRMPFSANHYATKLSPNAGDDAKRPVSHPEFPDKLNATKFDASTKGTSCYKKSSLSLGNIGQSNKDPADGFETTASPKAQFSPFPVRNAVRKPKELALKLGLYSPKGSDIGQLKRS